MLFFKKPGGALLHGDCLEEMKRLPDNSIDMILCDLPYGTTRNKWDSVLDLKLLWAEYRRICKGSIVLTAAQPFTAVLCCSNLQDFKYQWTWVKGTKPTNFLNAKKQPLRIIEEVLVFTEDEPLAEQALVFGAGDYTPQMVEGSKCHSVGKAAGGVFHQTENYGLHSRTETAGTLKYPQDVLFFGRDKDKLHPTQKPVALFEYLIKTYTNEGALVLDNCAGSGTTAVACENLNRRWCLIEKEQKYCEIIVTRLKGGC